MKRIDERTSADIDVALDFACAALPNGGDHETRRHVAERLLRAARHGMTTIGALKAEASKALKEIRPEVAHERRQD